MPLHELLFYRIVKLTSPGLNYMLLFGIVLMALGTLTLPDRANDVMVATLCTVCHCTTTSIHIRHYCFSSVTQMHSLFAGVGYNIAIAVAIVKTWRVYYLFKNPRPDKKVYR